MQLAAHDIGVGCVWIAVYPLEDRVEACRGFLAIPPDITPFALLAMGIPAERPGPEYRFDGGRVHHNGW